MSTRSVTMTLQRDYPVGLRVEFWDANHATRIGDIVGHAKGRLVIVSPPHSRRSPITKTMWRQIARKHRVKPQSLLPAYRRQNA